MAQALGALLAANAPRRGASRSAVLAQTLFHFARNRSMNRTLETKQDRSRASPPHRSGGAKRFLSEASIDAALNRAIEHLKTGRNAAALACLRSLAAHEEERPERSNLAGLICLAANDAGSALPWFDRAIAIDPGHAQAWSNRGAALQELGRPEALACFDEALRLGLEEPTLFYNRGNLMLATQRPEAAIACYERALALRADYLDALIGRAGANKQLQCFDEALAGLDAALALEPRSDHARNNKAVLLLQRGDFEAGWELYESRWILSRTAKRALKLPVPEWEGQALEGKSILVFDEQGFGDAIQFVRFCLELAGLGADVSFFCRKSLHRGAVAKMVGI